MTELHAVLRRQLRRVAADIDTPPGKESWIALLEGVSRAYRASDEDRYTLERSLELVSVEMKTLYDRLSADRDRLERELEIARVLQTALLPRSPVVQTLEIAGRMVPAAEVGGDYYDIIPVGNACWIGIGDVAGHGLRAAIIMVMVQSMVAALTRASPDLSPSRLLELVNAGLWEGTRNRLGVDEHVTCTLLRVTPDGRVQYAGAHETLLIARARGGCERILSTGTWLSVTPELAGLNHDHEVQLLPGDLLVLYTDGAIEARNAERELFGIDRLAALTDSLRDLPPVQLCDEVFTHLAAWAPHQHDDITLVVVRYRG